MNIKNLIRNFVSTAFKLLWAGLCYIFSILLAVVSGYFTVIFYSEGSKSYDAYIMGFLAICLEGIKLILSFAYPYLKDRDKKNEKKILTILKISLIISILSNVYFLLLGGNIEKSPASKTIAMLYQYIPLLNIIPLKFSQFISTISLGVLIEYFIIFLPMIALIMFYEKNPDEKIIAKTNFEKVKEIITLIPDMLIDKLYKRVMNYANNDTSETVIEYKKPELKLIEGNSNTHDKDNSKRKLIAKPHEKELAKSSLERSTGKNTGNIFPENDSKDKKDINSSPDNVIDFMDNLDLKVESPSETFDIGDLTKYLVYVFKNKTSNNISPGEIKIRDNTKLSLKQVQDIRSFLENNNIVKIDNKTTYLQTDSLSESLNLIKSIKK